MPALANHKRSLPVLAGHHTTIVSRGLLLFAHQMMSPAPVAHRAWHWGRGCPCCLRCLLNPLGPISLTKQAAEQRWLSNRRNGPMSVGTCVLGLIWGLSFEWHVHAHLRVFGAAGLLVPGAGAGRRAPSSAAPGFTGPGQPRPPYPGLSARMHRIVQWRTACGLCYCSADWMAYTLPLHFTLYRPKMHLYTVTCMN